MNATTTLSTLLSLGVIPNINENDTISVSEILHINKFGDNDTLSAIAAGMCGADYLFLLTDVEGLYEDNPRKVPGARMVTKVSDIDQVRKMGQFVVTLSQTPLTLTLSEHLDDGIISGNGRDGNENHRRRIGDRRWLRDRHHHRLSPLSHTRHRPRSCHRRRRCRINVDTRSRIRDRSRNPSAAYPLYAQTASVDVTAFLDTPRSHPARIGLHRRGSFPSHLEIGTRRWIRREWWTLTRCWSIASRREFRSGSGGARVGGEGSLGNQFASREGRREWERF